MINNSNQEKFDKFRDKFNCLTFEKFTSTLTADKTLEVILEFHIDETIFFKPTLKIPYRKFYDSFYYSNDISALDSIIFHIGMVELVSYWKAVCPKNIVIKPFTLNASQIDFWRKIYFNGLGEFFYTNSIKTDIDKFVDINSCGSNQLTILPLSNSNKAIIPVGGGKDSAVTLSFAHKLYEESIPLILNPRGATLSTIEVAGYHCNDIIEIQRTIDPTLLKLNSEGYLNGHTPFSALLAFTTLLTSTLANIPNVLLSNESSANETTVIGSEVNHQYSKSFEFESDFRKYVHQNLSPNFNYFSFLRPLSELQIAALFSKLKLYHPIFKSCNAGSKTDSWCCNCPKCLFTFTILSPFISMPELVSIYGENLFEKESLLKDLDELTGLSPVKPFECVGTTEEVNLALWKTIQQHDPNQPLPFLLEYFKTSSKYKSIQAKDFNAFIHKYDNQHFLTEPAFNTLKEEILCIFSKK